ncbi:MAG: Wzz/FepE/Etk N-terminal domain-containing protein [Saccharofermentans sp.]|nr:Wzz/FepE/Etk N-terminal domain-containing protein [Saccharofermentans sp.]
MQNDNFNREEDTIDLLDLLKYLWNKVALLIVAAMLGLTIAVIYTIFFVTPQYRASSMIYVFSKTTSVTSVADLQIGSQLTIDFQIIATTRDVIEAAAQDIGLNASYENIVRKVTIENPGNSRIIKIVVTDANPQLACNLSNAIANQLRMRIATVMNTEEPSLVEAAIVPIHPVSPSIPKNAVIGGAGAFAIVAAVLVVIYLLDDSIKSEEDIEKYLKQNVLAVVPVVSSMSESKKGKKSKKTTSKSNVKVQHV